MPGDVLLVEQVDRLSRLNTADWEKLKYMISHKGLKVVSLDLPTSHQFMKGSDEFSHLNSVTANNSHAAGILPPLQCLFPGNTAREEKIPCWVSASEATKICAGYWFSAPARS